MRCGYWAGGGRGYWARVCGSVAGGGQVYPLEQPDEALGMDPWPPAAADADDPDARPGGTLPPGAVCRDAVTGVALDELGFPLDADGPGGAAGLAGAGGPLSMLRSLPRPGGRRPGGR